jgi:fructoselysine-6-P-deglycase FrlB-like protein
MPKNNYFTLDEILTQITAWKEAIEVVDKNRIKIKELELGKYRQIIVIGCGSTYYLSLAASFYFIYKPVLIFSHCLLLYYCFFQKF